MGDVFRKHERWAYKVKLLDGTWPTILTHAATKAEARQIKRDHEVKIDRQRMGLEPIEPARPIPTVEAFVPDYLRHKRADRRKPSTEDSRESRIEHWILPTLGAYALDKIDVAAIDLLREAMEELSRNTANNVLCILANMLRVAVTLKAIPEMPVEKVGLYKVDNSKPPAFYSEEELGRLLDAAIKLDTRTAAIVLLGADAGLRLGEIRALAPWDIKWDTMKIHVERQLWQGIMGTPKSGKGRIIGMTDRLAWVLRKLGRVKGDYLLTDDDGERFEIHRLQTLVRQAKREAGLEATGAVHVLRHTFCTRLAMRGTPAVTIQKLAGHAHLTTTMRYMHVVPGEAERAIGTLNAPLPTGLAPQDQPAAPEAPAALPVQLSRVQ